MSEVAIVGIILFLAIFYIARKIIGIEQATERIERRIEEIQSGMKTKREV